MSAAIVGCEVADADILTVAAKVGNRQRPVVENADEAGRPATVLDVGPAALRYGRHVEAVALGDERLFCFGKAVRGPVAFETAPIFAAPVRFLRGADPRGGRDVEKAIAHVVPP
jgi:hypothetical protein